MPRKPNYQFEKRQKELDRQARKAEKLQRRRERSEGAEGGADEAQVPNDGGVPPAEG